MHQSRKHWKDGGTRVSLAEIQLEVPAPKQHSRAMDKVVGARQSSGAQGNQQFVRVFLDGLADVTNTDSGKVFKKLYE